MSVYVKYSYWDCASVSVYFNSDFITDNFILMCMLFFYYLFSVRFDAIVSADAFENLKPAPDIFLAASKILNVPISEVGYYVSLISVFRRIFFC